MMLQPLHNLFNDNLSRLYLNFKAVDKQVQKVSFENEVVR